MTIGVLLAKEEKKSKRGKKNESSSFEKSSSPHVVRKPQVTHQGVLIRKVPVPVSPYSKKRKAKDITKHLSKKKKKKSRKLVITNESTEEDERIPETPDLDLIKELSTPEQTSFIPPEDSNVKSSNEATRTLDIPVYVSNMDTNVNMGEEGSKDEIQGNPISTTSETFVSLPPQITLVTSTTDSPTFEHIINQPFTSIFSSESTDPPKSISPVDATIVMETDTDNEVFGGTFEALAFDDDEADFSDHMLMTMKQFKILNSKLNTNIQSQDDLGGGSSVSSLEVDSMLKLVKTRIINKFSGMVKGGEKRIERTKAGEEAKVSGEYLNVVGKVFSSKIPSSKPVIMFVGPVPSTVVTSMPMTRPV
ncbi:unnamed protein product [Lactuca saligna]|uniref:Uncharacterized protein n=1 Tax=Lactuca saligna TaxID=75948 RepID=A0AA36ERB6_LACSI|nr:unnamed protein product [Lactuca saligna]